MKVQDREVERLYQSSTASGDRARCPDAAELVALAHGELGAPARASLVEHLAGCSSCALEVQLAMELEHEAGQQRGTPVHATGEGADSDVTAGRWSSPRRRTPWQRLALAATLLVAIAAGVWLLTPVGTPGDEVLRGEDAEVVPPRGVELDAPPSRFEWAPQPGATGYRVVLLDERAERLWRSELVDEPLAALPIESSARLPRGHSYLWLVEVEGPVARRELGPYRFDLAP